MISTLKNQHTEKDEPTLPLKYFELENLQWRYCMIMVCYGRYWPSGMIFLQNSTFDRLVATLKNILNFIHPFVKTCYLTKSARTRDSGHEVTKL